MTSIDDVSSIVPFRNLLLSRFQTSNHSALNNKIINRDEYISPKIIWVVCLVLLSIFLHEDWRIAKTLGF